MLSFFSKLLLAGFLVCALATGVIVLLVNFNAPIEQPSLPTVTNFNECASTGYPVGESYPRQCWTPDGRHFVEEILLSREPVTIIGVIGCLPKKGAGAQTLECAIGLKVSDRNYYALKDLHKIDPEYRFSQTGLEVEIVGELIYDKPKGPDGNFYDVEGTIQVLSAREL